MRLRTTGPSTMPELLRELGVPDGELGALAKTVAAKNHVSESGALPVGTELELDDRLFASRLAALPSAGADVGKPMGALGIFGLQRTVDARSEAARQNDLSALASLAALAIPKLIDGGGLEATMPLRPGRATLPLGDGRAVAIAVPKGCVLKVSARLVNGRGGPEITTADLAFSRPVEVLNPGSATMGDGVLGAIGDAAVGVSLDGLRIERGRAIPRGTVVRPSLNPLRYLFSDGTKEMSLETFAIFAPSVPTRLVDVTGSDRFHFDYDALAHQLGALVESGTFKLSLQGRAGFIDVGEGRIAVRGRSSPLTATIAGTFSTKKDGTADVQSQVDLRTPWAGGTGTVKAAVDLDRRAVDLEGDGKMTTSASRRALPVRIDLDDKARAGIGALDVAASADGIELRVGGALLALVHAIKDYFHVDIASGVEADLDGALDFHGKGRLSIGDKGVDFASEDVHATIEAGGSNVKGDEFAMTLGKDATVTLDATGVRFDGTHLTLENASAGVAVDVAAGTGTKGMLAALLKDGRLDGKFMLSADENDLAGQGAAQFRVRAKPMIGSVPLPGSIGVGGGLKVKLLSHAVVFYR